MFFPVCLCRDRLVFLLIIFSFFCDIATINKCMNNSREWANFKRNFVGPVIPRRIRKIRRELLPPEVPVLGPINLKLEFGDNRKLWDRKAIHRYAMPFWADKSAIKEIYNEAKILTKNTGVEYHVDHIIPIRHPLVCGLHVEHNLRVITKSENSQKSNFFVIK